MNNYSRHLYIAKAFITAVALVLLVYTSMPARCYWKDLQQEYLTAWALRDGIDIFTPLNELSARYFPVTTSAPDSSPHPPFLALVSLPLTLMPFPVVVMLWLAINIALLIAVGRWLGLSVQGTLFPLAWPPLLFVLHVGNFELLILALAMLGWRAAAAGRDMHAGLWLGIAAAIKLYPILLLVPFVVRWRVRLLMAAGLVIILSQLGGLVTVGISGMVRYYGEILPAVSAKYQHLARNTSPYGALLRWFGGSTNVEPLLHAPGVVLPVTIAISLFALLALARLEPEAAPVAILSCSSRSLGYVCNVGFTADNHSAALTKPEARSITCGSGCVCYTAVGGEPVIDTAIPTDAIARQRGKFVGGRVINNPAGWNCRLTGSVHNTAFRAFAQPS